MIQSRSRLHCADNTGAKVLRCIKVLGGTRRRYARLGDTIVVSVTQAIPHGQVKKSDVCRVVIVRLRKETRRKDGTYIRFDDNAGVVLEKDSKDPRGSRIFGPIAREIKTLGFSKIASLASEVL